MPDAADPSAWRRLFVGREGELGDLLARFERARAGEPQYVVLLGESGLGKTRLVQAFYERLAAAPPGGCDPNGYWPDRIAVGDSLLVNPRFDPSDDRPRPAMPFLWWGLRWSDAGQRNDASAGCALLDARPALEPHVEPLRRGRELSEKNTSLLWAAGKTLAGFVPIVGAATGLHDVYEMSSGALEARRVGADQEGVGQAEQRQRTELADLTLDFFRGALSTKDSGRAIPALLVLDNAQAADGDPETLKFVERLATEAKRHGWPLMILVTHWEAEWKTNLRTRRAHVSDPPRRFADLYDLLTGTGAWELYDLKPVPDLLSVVRAALPGLTDAQADLVAAQAGGNPRLLDEIVRSLQRRANKYFENGDPAATLTDRGERFVEEEEFDLHRLVADRFAALPETVRRTLGWSSVQGTRFLTNLTHAAARRSDSTLTDEAVTAALRHGHDPHCFVQPIGEPGEFNLGEFRQAAFFKAVREEFGDESEEVAHAAAALKETLTEWLDERPTGMAPLDEMPADERRLAIELVGTHLRPADEAGSALESLPEQAWRPWGSVMCRSISEYAREHQWDRALAAAREFADARDWSATDLPGRLVTGRYGPAMLLWQFRDLERARAVSKGAVAAAGRRLELDLGGVPAGPADAAEWWRDYGVALNVLSRVEADAGQYAEALRLCSLSAEVGDRSLEVFGATPQRLYGRVVPLMDLGRLTALGDRDAGIAYFEQALTTSRDLLHAEPESPWFRKLTGSVLSSLAHHEWHRASNPARAGRLKRSRRYAEEAVELLEQCRRDGPGDPECLRLLSISLNVVGRIGRLEGDDEAAAAFRRSAAATRLNIAISGRTPEAIRDLIVVSRERSRSALAAHRPIVAIQRLRECLTWYGKLEDAQQLTRAERVESSGVRRELGNALTHAEQFPEARDLLEAILNEARAAAQTETNESLFSLSLAHWNLAQLDAAEGLLADACQNAAEVHRHLVTLQRREWTHAEIPRVWPALVQFLHEHGCESSTEASPYLPR